MTPIARNPQEQQAPREGKIHILSLFWEFFKIGLFTIGGGLAMIPLLERVAAKRGWLSEEDMVDCFAISQALPGVVAINMATYVGKRKRGFLGALAATVGVVLPSFLIILFLANLLLRLGENTHLIGAFTGIKAGLVGMIVALLVRMAHRTIKSVPGAVICLLAFGLIIFAGINVIWVILVAATGGALWQILRQETGRGRRP